MKLRFLIDENVTPCLKFVLNEWGYSAEAVSLRGDLRSLPDEDILSTAVKENRVVVTFNTDHFEELQADYAEQGWHHSGIVVCREQEGYVNFTKVLAWMRNLLKTESPSSLADQLRHLHTY